MTKLLKHINKKQISKILDLCPTPVFSCNGKGKLLFVNTAASDLFNTGGRKLDKMISMIWQNYEAELKNSSTMNCIQIPVSEQIFSFTIVQSPDEEMVTFYGREIPNKTIYENRLNSDNKSRQVSFNFPVGMLAVNNEGEIKECNTSMTEILGYTPFELIGKSIYALLLNADHEELALNIASMGTHRQDIYKAEKQMLHRDGYYLWASINCFLAEPDAESGYLFAFIITNIQQQKSNLYKFEDELQLPVTNVGGAFFVHDMDGRFRNVNEEARKLFGYSEEEFTQISVFDLETAILPMEAKAGWKSIPLGQPITIQTNAKKKDGNQFRLEIRAVCILFHNERLCLGFLQDITEGLEIKNKFRENEELYRSIFESVAEGILVYDDRRGYIAANNNAIEMFEVSREELLGRKYLYPLIKLFDIEGNPIPAEFSPVFNVLKTGQPSIQIQMGFNRRDGSKFWASLNAVPIFAHGEHLPHAVALTIRDVTLQREARELLNRREQQYRELFENNPQPMWIFAAEALEFLAVNDAAIEKYGYGREEFLEMTLLRLIPEDEINDLMNALAEATEGFVLSRNWRHILKSGMFINVEIHSHSINYQGKAAHLVLVNDVTDQKKAQDLLKRTNEELEMRVNQRTQDLFDVQTKRDNILANIEEVVWSYDMGEEKWVYISPASKVMFNVAPEAFYQDSRLLLQFASKSDYSRLLNFPSFDEDGFADHIFKITLANETVKWIKARAISVKDKTGQNLLLNGTFSDCSSQQIAELKLVESEKKYRMLMEAAGEPIILIDLSELRITDVNKSLLRFSGYAQEELIGTRPDFLVFPDDYQKLYSEYGGELSSPDFLTNTVFFRHKSNERIPVRFRTSPVLIDDKRYLLAIVLDQRERIKTETELKEAYHKERELNQLKSKFASTASHQFRTPLSVIQSSIDMLGMVAEKEKVITEQHLKEIAERITTEVYRMTNIMDKMLLLAKSESGPTAIKPQLEDIVKISRELIFRHFSLRKDERSVRIIIEGIPHPVSVDKKIFEHILSNLLSNAFKYSVGKTDPILKLEFSKTEFRIYISDEGIGIPQGDLPNIFKSFYRAHNTEGIEGTGLGLVIAKDFVEMHRGTIQVHSKENEGTTFIVTFPSL